MDSTKPLLQAQTLQLSTFLNPTKKILFQHSIQWTGATSPQNAMSLGNCVHTDRQQALHFGYDK